jgi:hypothetical protein
MDEIKIGDRIKVNLSDAPVVFSAKIIAINGNAIKIQRVYRDGSLGQILFITKARIVKGN